MHILVAFHRVICLVAGSVRYSGSKFGFQSWKIHRFGLILGGRVLRIAISRSVFRSVRLDLAS